MKAVLRLLVFIGVAWLVALAFESRIAPAFQLDAVLPPKLLAAATPEERNRVEDRLRHIAAPGFFSWSGAAQFWS